MKTFDFDECAKRHSPTTVALLKEIHNQPVSEEEFVARYCALPHGSGHRSPSYAKDQYRRLKNNFGFFQ